MSDFQDFYEPNNNPGDLMNDTIILKAPDEIGIAAWSPEKDGVNPTQVHLFFSIDELDVTFLIRFHSANTLTGIIAKLVECRDLVWPDGH